MVKGIIMCFEYVSYRHLAVIPKFSPPFEYVCGDGS